MGWGKSVGGGDEMDGEVVGGEKIIERRGKGGK